MYPTAFAYHTPSSLDEALELLQRLGEDVRLLAGGHSLVPMMKLRLSAPRHVVDLGRIAALKGIAERDDMIALGAMTTHWEIESSDLVAARLPALAEMASGIADPLVRNRGTIGGSLAHADPAADYPAAMLLWDATMVCVGPEGERSIPASEWFHGIMTTAMTDTEILREIRIPRPHSGLAAAYAKHPHPATGFAVVGSAAALRLGQDGRIMDARVAITGAGPTPVRAARVQAALIGQVADSDVIEAAIGQAADGIDCNADLHCSAERRAHLCRVMTRRALELARDRLSLAQA